MDVISVGFHNTLCKKGHENLPIDHYGYGYDFTTVFIRLPNLEILYNERDFDMQKKQYSLEHLGHAFNFKSFLSS